MKNVAAEVELEALVEAVDDGVPITASLMPFLDSVPVKVSVRVGEADLTVAELLALKQGAVLALDVMLEQPLDVLVSGHVVARGKLVAVGDHFGVRISEVAETKLRGRA